MKLRLGTRKSLLALAQSGQMKAALEAAHPGLTVELIGIETRGDQILDKPLHQIDGKEFFTAELDLALLRGDVDLTVHSFKDLSLERPAAITLAAVPERALPHDVALFAPDIEKRVKEKHVVRIGTSSPRRLAFTPKLLQELIPGSPTVEIVSLRGNVNTRLSKIFEPTGSPQALDGVILAAAGLERLLMDSSCPESLRTQVSAARKMILPLLECAPAPAQGALAIEAKSDSKDVIRLISAIHDPVTADGVHRERQFLAESGGGCHQKLGAIHIDNIGTWNLEEQDGKLISRLRRGARYTNQKKPKTATIVRSEDMFRRHLLNLSASLLPAGPLFVAHSSAWIAGAQKDRSVWCAGSSTWRKLAQQGVWVEACADGLGELRFSRIAKSRILGAQGPLVQLTHQDAAGPTDAATYTLKPHEIRSSFYDSDAYFWTSGSQWQRASLVAKERGIEAEFRNKTHACGPGKTETYLRQCGIDPLVFLNGKDFESWTLEN
jgi:hydroxymethylbilane synthase